MTHPYRPLVVEVETLDAKRERLRCRWQATLMMQASPEAKAAERAAWSAYSAALAER